MWAGKLPEGWDKGIPTFPGRCQGPGQPRLVGQGAQRPGQALSLADRRLGRPGPLDDDAAGADRQPEQPQLRGRNLHFGIREHGMAAVCNGMSLCGLRPYGATFFVFTDYLRPSLRLSAIMQRPVIYVLTHDSIGLGEDGPTHQPIEHLAACRAIPEPRRGPPRRRQRSGRVLPHRHPAADAARRRWSSRGRTCRRSTARSSPPPPAVRPRRLRPGRSARAASRRRSSWPPAASSTSP